MNKRILGLMLVVSLGLNVGLLLPRIWTEKKVTGESVDSQKGCGWHLSPLRSKLGLTKVQAEQMELDRSRMLDRLAPLQALLRGKRQDLFDLFRKPGLETVVLDRLLQEIATLQARIEKEVVEHALQVKAMLNPEQLRQYETLLERELCPMMGNSQTTCLPECAQAPRHQHK